MVYELTLSDNPKKAICRQESARVKAMGFCRKEFLNTKEILTETIALPTHQVGTANNKKKIQLLTETIALPTRSEQLINNNNTIT